MRVLDLFCGAGGAAMGYHQAGFEVVGVDINSQPNYPFEFVLGDAMTYPLDGFDLIHASPPCQAYASSFNRWPNIKRADLAGPTRERLEAFGTPYVIENVTGASKIIGANLVLCGQMFGLGVIRHRAFAIYPERNLIPPFHPKCYGLIKAGLATTVAGHGGNNVKGRGTFALKKKDMGIDWMTTTKELNESVPPAYTEWIGNQIAPLL